VARKIGIGIVFVWFLIGGIGHFAAADFFLLIVPPYIPFPREVVYVSGICELAGAVGMLIPRVRRAAGLGLFLLTIAVSLANIHMRVHAELFPSVPVWAMDARLVLQVALLVCILWASGWTDGRKWLGVAVRS
jgi:uncharacterized membrane protein